MRNDACFRLPRAAALVVAGALLAAGCGAGRGGSLARMPDVLLITLDTTRADHLGCYDEGAGRAGGGGGGGTSPRLDAIARGGTLFERAIAQAAVTPVSHAALLSGMYPFHSGLRFLHGTRGYRLPDDVPTLAEVLARIGFDTAAFISAFPCGKRFGLERGFRSFDDPFTDHPVGRAVTPEGVVNTGRNQRTALETNRAVFQWIEFRARPPWFAWVHYFDPHDTMVIPEDRSIFERFPARDPSRKAQLQAAYDAEIRFMDEQLGNLVDRVEMLERPVLLAVVADHGQGLDDHGWWGHSILYQEQIRVPMILRGPGVPAGRRIPSLVRGVDLAPTLLALLGLDPRVLLPGADGVDLTPLLAGGREDLGLEAYAEQAAMGMLNEVPYRKGKYDALRDQLFCLIEGDWKYVHHRHRPGESELYDLASDPREERNLLGEHPDLVERFRERLEGLGAYDFRRALEGGAMSEEDRRKLRSLGYLGGDEDGGEKENR